MFKKHKFGISIAVIVIIILGFAFAGNSKDTADSVGSTFTEVNMESLMAIGNEDAPVSIIQYSDFLCPSCSYFSTQIMPTIHKDYIDQGIVKFEFRPMAFIAKGSWDAGAGAYCAVEQNMFWGYHDAVYTHVVNSVFGKGLDPTQDVIVTPDIVKAAGEAAGLDVETFNECVDSGRHYDDLKESTRAANANGVNSTPYIIINGERVNTANNMTVETFEALIKANM